MSFNIPDVLAVLMPNALTVIIQLCATGILFFALYKLLWKPVKKIMDTRSEYEQSRLNEAQKLKEESEKLNKEAQEKLDNAAIEAQNIVNNAQGEAVKVRETLIEEGRQRSQQLIADAQENITLQKNKMLEDMHEEIVNVAISAAEKMLQTKLDSDSDKESIEGFIKEVTNK